MARARSARKARKSRAIKEKMHKKSKAATAGDDGRGAAAVLGTTELLEAILKHLPMKDILLAHRVSRGFHDTIKDSISLQQQLFLKPVESREGPRTWNPLLIPEQKDWLIMRTRPSFEHSDVSIGGCCHLCIAFEDDPIWVWRFPRPGNCADMYLTQPPIKYVNIWIDGHELYRLPGEAPEDAYRGGRAWSSRYRHREIGKNEGITWGDLCAAIMPPNAREKLRGGRKDIGGLGDAAKGVK